ncbi:hypothetical protein [Anabaena sp. CCY 9910]
MAAKHISRVRQISRIFLLKAFEPSDAPYTTKIIAVEAVAYQ